MFLVQQKCKEIGECQIDNDLKNLTDISELAFPSLNRFIYYTGSVRKDNKIKEMIEKYNKQA